MPQIQLPPLLRHGFLAPLRAVAMAAFFNMIGPLLFTTAVAKTIGKGIVDPMYLTPFVIVIGMFVAVIWVYLSSYVGIPISATHALVGGLIGSAVAYRWYRRDYPAICGHNYRVVYVCCPRCNYRDGCLFPHWQSNKRRGNAPLHRPGSILWARYSPSRLSLSPAC